jgi:hypothetical protein
VHVDQIWGECLFELDQLPPRHPSWSMLRSAMADQNGKRKIGILGSGPPVADPVNPDNVTTMMALRARGCQSCRKNFSLYIGPEELRPK